MRALTVEPGRAGSLAVTDDPDPVAGPGELLVDELAIGVCGIDQEIASGASGALPLGRERLVLGAWLERLLTCRVPRERVAGAFEARDEDVDVVVDLRPGGRG